MPRLTLNSLFGGFFVILVAFFLVIWWGRIGIAWFDYSSFVDISYRLMNGQKMYVDIGGTPHAPLTYFLQALFFKIFGVKLFTCLIHAAVINAIAAAIIYFYFLRFLPSPWPLLLGLITGLYFYGIAACPWPEKLGYLGILIAFILWEKTETSRRPFLLLLLIGALAAFPLWDKQNLALVSTLGNGILLLVYAFRSKRWSSIFWFSAGYLVVVGTLFLYFWLNGWEESLFEYFVRGQGYHRWVELLHLESYLTFWHILIILGLVMVSWQWFLEKKIPHLKWRLICLTTLAGIQVLNAPLGSASVLTDFPLAALFCGWVISLIEGRYNLVTSGALFFLIVFGFYLGATPTFWRLPTARDPNTLFEPLNHPFFKGFKVQQPDAKEWDHALAWLQSHRKASETFWVFPTGGLFYAPLGEVSNSPLVVWDLMNMPDLRVRQKDEEKGLNWLRKFKPTWIVMLRKSFYPDIGSHDPSVIMAFLPRIADFFGKTYLKEYGTKMFEFYHIHDEKQD